MSLLGARHWDIKVSRVSSGFTEFTVRWKRQTNMQLQCSVISSWMEELKRVTGAPNSFRGAAILYGKVFFRGSKVCLPQSLGEQVG